MSEPTGAAAQPESAGLGHYVWPPVWIGAAPDWTRAPDRTEFRPEDLADVIVQIDDLPGGLRARAHRDGMIFFDFSPWGSWPPPPKDWTDSLVKRIRLMNAHLACLHTVVEMKFKPTPLTPSRAIRGTFEDLYEAAMSGHESTVVMHFMIARHPETYRGPPSVLGDPRLHRFTVISEDEMRRSFELLTELLLDSERHPDVLLYAELLLRSGAAYQDDDYSAALTNAWTLSEGLIGHLWKAYLDECSERLPDHEGYKFMPTKRKKWLEGAAEMSVRHRIEILSLVGRLPLSLYRAAHEPRKRRNDWLHNQAVITRADASAALRLAGDLFEFAEGIPLAMPH